MKINNQRIFEGRNIYSHKSCMRLDVDLEGYCETPTKDIDGFNERLLNYVPELYTHRCGIDVEGGFVERLKEGTYLAHVCEHTIIGLHNKLGIDVKYGKAREIKDDFYYIIFEYKLKKTAILIAELAVDLMNAIINKKDINFDERIEIIKRVIREEGIGPSTKAICDAANDVGLPVISIGNGNLYQIGYGKAGKRFSATIGSNTKGIAIDIACDKMLTKELLDIQNLPVAKGEKVFSTLQLLEVVNRIGYPVVLKPQWGSKGNGVFVNINNEKELLRAYAELIKECKEVMIEEYKEGNDYRVMLVDYKVVAVSLRKPPFITGDGVRNIRDLIDAMNANPLRGEGHEKPLTKVKIDEELVNRLEKLGYSLNSILKYGEKLILRGNANLSTGGSAEDYTDLICKENIEICERAAKAIGLDICGIDICTKSISEPLYDTDGIILEVNAAPGIRMHHFPTVGKERNVGKKILDNMFKNGYDNIPVISVTGTNGKTTTVRLISYILKLMGFNVGCTTTSGVKIGDKYIHKGDDTGYESAKSVLLNPEVEVAVLESARGGLVRRGLAYNLADVGVITNIGEDHLGIDGINDLEDLAFVKSLVGEAVKDNGYSVINADDEWSIKILDRIKKPKILFSMDENNKYLQDNLKNGNPIVFYRDGTIYVKNRGKEYKIASAEEMKFTMNGKLKHNIENAMAACAALVGIEVDYCIISKGLKQFKSCEEDNRGRFNMFDVNGVNVILDYGHNIDGYKVIIESLKNIGLKNITGIIGVPGDRDLNTIKTVGKLSGEFFDSIVIKEDKDLRGREKGEVANIMLEGVKEASRENLKISTILSEEEALRETLKIAKKGDTIIMFFEDYEPLYNIISEFKNSGAKGLKSASL
ncbi:cyanophycin synthetase [Clostridium perfringens]|nr:cyanophycin synthetase [Clostridium perfringens]